MRNIKAEILAKIAEIEDLLLEAQCDGMQLAELDCYKEVDTAVGNLLEQIDYYVD